MEERRISRLYLANAKKRLASLLGAEFRRSRAFPLLVLAVALGIPAALWFAHTHAFFHKTKEKIADDQPQAVASGPGGREPLTFSRQVTPDAAVPEFASATVLPGLGLDLVQITAAMPGHGKVPLLVAPSEQELTDDTAARSGPNDDHGAIEVPWGGLLTGLRAIVGSSLMLDFHGNTFSVPLDGKGNPIAAEGGLLATRNADSATVSTIPGGVVMNGFFADTDFDGHWRSKSQVRVKVEFTANALDLTTTVTNTGEEAEPMGIGWHPRFQFSGARGAVQLHLPQGQVLGIRDRSRELPSGQVEAAPESVARFFSGQQTLDKDTLDEALVQLKPGPRQAELLFPAAGYGLRLQALSPSIQELRVHAPADKNFVSVGFQTNYDDPLSPNWVREPAATVVLQPGQTLEYKVRLEIFPLGRGAGRTR